MPALPQPSIRRKLTLTIAITSALALALAAAALVVYDISTYRQALTRDVEALADLVGNNSTASLAFGDGTAATRDAAVARRPAGRRSRGALHGVGPAPRRLHPHRRRRAAVARRPATASSPPAASSRSCAP